MNESMHSKTVWKLGEEEERVGPQANKVDSH